MLKDHLCGVNRTPALCYGNEKKSMSDINLSKYEVCPCEPLHDCKGHIKNVWEVIKLFCSALNHLALVSTLNIQAQVWYCVLCWTIC